MQQVELVEGDCSHPPLNDDVSDIYIYYFYYYDMEYEYDEIHVYHNSPIQTKLAEKTIQVVGGLVGDPRESKKTRSQFHNAFLTCDLNIKKRCFIMVVYDPY